MQEKTTDGHVSTETYTHTHTRARAKVPHMRLFPAASRSLPNFGYPIYSSSSRTHGYFFVTRTQPTHREADAQLLRNRHQRLVEVLLQNLYGDARGRLFVFLRRSNYCCCFSCHVFFRLLSPYACAPLPAGDGGTPRLLLRTAGRRQSISPSCPSKGWEWASSFRAVKARGTRAWMNTRERSAGALMENPGIFSSLPSSVLEYLLRRRVGLFYSFRKNGERSCRWLYLWTRAVGRCGYTPV